MRILQVASEAFGLVKTGGLADAVAGLHAALLTLGEDSRILLPAYPGCAELAQATVRWDLGDPLGVGRTRILEGTLPAPGAETSTFTSTVWLVECPELYDRPGGPYLDEHGQDWPDNHLRFGLLGRVAAMLGMAGHAMGWEPDIVHAHDWQAGLAPALLSIWGGRRPATVFTVHNLAFRGAFDAASCSAVGIPERCYDMYGVELYGTLSFLKAGLYYADRLTTVSPTYASEIQRPETGEGLHGLLSGRRADLHGIVNGIDEQIWNPAGDSSIPAAYDASNFAGKAQNKAALQRRFGLDVDAGVPLLGSVGRLSTQKGIDLLVANLPRLLESGVQLAVIGSGDGALENVLETAARANPGQVGFFRGYDETRSHLVFAGADLFVVPSRFEPCGLTQLYAMRYGTVPVVRRTGGLRDTVTDATQDNGTGFLFDEPTTAGLEGALKRALQAFAVPDVWRGLQVRGMQHDFGWHRPAQRYRAMYREVVGPGVK